MASQSQTAAVPTGVPSATSGTSGCLQSVEASTGRVVAEIPETPVSAIPEMTARARRAQLDWAALSVHSRCAYLRRLRDAIYENRDEVTRTISLETGKPHVEAVFAELLLALDATDFFARRAPEWLRP